MFLKTSFRFSEKYAVNTDQKHFCKISFPTSIFSKLPKSRDWYQAVAYRLAESPAPSSALLAHGLCQTLQAQRAQTRWRTQALKQLELGASPGFVGLELMRLQALI